MNWWKWFFCCFRSLILNFRLAVCFFTYFLDPVSSSSTFSYGATSLQTLVSIWIFISFILRLPRHPFSHPGPTSHAHAFIRNGAFVFGLGTLVLYLLVLIKVQEHLEHWLSQRVIIALNVLPWTFLRMWLIQSAAVTWRRPTPSSASSSSSSPWSPSYFCQE